MQTSTSVDIAAPPARVWEIWTDVQRWHEWTASILGIEPLDGPLRVGARFRIRQPRMPVLVWEVTELDPGVSWSWVSRSPGAVTTGRHLVVPAGEGTRAEQHIIQEGLLGPMVGWLMQGMTRRYLAMEGEGLKRVCERA